MKKLNSKINPKNKKINKQINILKMMSRRAHQHLKNLKNKSALPFGKYKYSLGESGDQRDKYYENSIC